MMLDFKGMVLGNANPYKSYNNSQYNISNIIERAT